MNKKQKTETELSSTNKEQASLLSTFPSLHSLSLYFPLFSFLCCSFATVFAVKRIIARALLLLLLPLLLLRFQFSLSPSAQIYWKIPKFLFFFVIDGEIRIVFSLSFVCVFTHFLCRLSDALAATSSKLNPGANAAPGTALGSVRATPDPDPVRLTLTHACRSHSLSAMRWGREGGRRRLLMGSVNVSQPLSDQQQTPPTPVHDPLMH